MVATMTPEAVRQNWIKWALDAVSEGEEQYQKYEDYYSGDHQLAFATTKWVSTFGAEFEEFADNWCQVVVDAVVQRMEILGFKNEDSKSMNKEAEAIWDRNRGTIENEDLMTQTLVKGDGYLIVWKDPDNDSQSQIFYNDPLEVAVYYDPANRRRIARATKKFVDQKGQIHLYIYFPDRTEKYFIPATATESQIAAMGMGLMVNTDQHLPAGWFKEAADIPNPYGRVPIFHFRNRAMGSTHGISELKSVIPVQNAINKLIMDMMVGSEFGSFRQKWMAGGGHPKDGWRTGGDRMWATTDPSAKFGEFGQIDLEPIFKAVETMVGHVAKITQTPMHYLRSSGDMPSGEALKSAESGLIKKCLQRQKMWGATWADAMEFALKIEGVKNVESPIIPVWRSPETRHELEQAQTAQLKSLLGIPLERLWSEHFGYTEEEIEGFKEMNKAIAASVLADVIAQAGQLPPGTDQVTATPDQLIQLLKAGNQPGNGSVGKGGLDISQVLSLLPKSITSQTTAGESTVKPQPHSRPPGSPTRRNTGFKD